MLSFLYQIGINRLHHMVVCLVILCYPIGSEIIYRRDISPSGLSMFREFTGKLDEEALARVFEGKDGRVLRFTGRAPRRGLLTMPSSPPHYYFHESGNFLDWERNPEDNGIPERFEATGKGRRMSFEDASEILSEARGL
ncbi:MAG: hypothetical protein AAF357_01305 [Verrucomicrobiota bacterium]